MSKKKQSSKRRRQRQPQQPQPPSRRDWLTTVGLTTVGLVGTWIAAGMSILSYRRQADQLVPQRQAVELSGVTHHRVDAVGISVSVRLGQAVGTVVRAPVVWRA